MSAAGIDLRTGSIGKHLIRMTIPMIWSIAAIVSFQLVDTYYVSLLGTTQLAAMTFTFPVTFFYFSIFLGFGIAMSSVVSRLIGEGREEDVKRVTTHGLFLVFGVGLIFAIVGYAIRDPLFRALGADEDMRPLIHDYMTIWFFGAPLLATPFTGNSAMRAAGSTAAPALIMVGAALLNAALAPLLVFGLLGFPRLELQGAAIATVFSNLIAMIASLYLLGAKKKMLLPLFSLRFDLFGESAKRLLMIAVPVALTSVISPIVGMVVTHLLARYGTETVAAYGIATRVEAFAFVILMALAAGMSPIIGQNFGARNFERVRETLQKAIGFSVFWCLAAGIVLTVFGDNIAKIFSQDAIVVYYATLAFTIIAPTYLFSSLINGWSSAFNAMGKPQISFFITIIKMLLLQVPALYIAARLWGVYGIFGAIAAVNIVTGIAFHLWARRYCEGQRAQLAVQAS
jgi:putative MATE family efflux protein